MRCLRQITAGSVINDLSWSMVSPALPIPSRGEEDAYINRLNTGGRHWVYFSEIVVRVQSLFNLALDDCDGGVHRHLVRPRSSRNTALTYG
jgi:hypothetical protein